MRPDQVHLNDFARIFIGHLPACFLLETALRGSVLYLLLLVSMRLMGRRMAAQLSRNEMAALVSLAATVGIPMQVPDKGIVPAIVIALVLVALHKFIVIMAFRHRAFEKVLMEEMEPLVIDGCLNMKALKKNSISRDLVTTQLRKLGIESLGSVKRFFYEPSGGFTILKNKEKKPGLTLFPEWDEEIRSRQPKADETWCCYSCGFLRTANGDKRDSAKSISEVHPEDPNSSILTCFNCGQNRWTEAVFERSEE